MEDNRWCFAWFIAEQNSGGIDRAALARGSKWRPGDTITVSFLDGDESLKQKVKNIAQEWTGPDLANLELDFRNSTNTVVRVSFQFSGSWSLVGTDCVRRTDLEIPTMNLEITPSSPDEMIRRKVLHEFGHALGLIHEHQSPNAGIQWNEQRVIGDLSGPPNEWTEAEIRRNVLTPENANQTNSTTFDAESIMVYPIPSHWTQNGFSVDWNSELSQRDKDFIRDQYPL